MDLVPDTKISLILRPPQSSDVEAWREFVDVYEPFILRLARSRGLQEDDARELVQRVMVAVARAVDRCTCRSVQPHPFADPRDHRGPPDRPHNRPPTRSAGGTFGNSFINSETRPFLPRN